MKDQDFPVVALAPISGVPHARLGLAYLLHMWVPVVTVLSMARCLVGHVGHPAAAGLDPRGLQVLGLGVFIVYTGDRLLEHGQHWGRMQQLLWGAVGAASVVVGVMTLVDPPLWTTTAALGALSLSYLKLKPVAGIKTLIVGLTWTVGCAVLAQAPQPGWEAIWTPAAGALLLAVCAGGILCDLKDAEADRQHGVRSLPVLLGERGAIATAALLCVGGAGLAMSVDALGVAACNAAMLLLCPLPQLVRRPVVGPLSVDSTLALPGLWLYLS